MTEIRSSDGGGATKTPGGISPEDRNALIVLVLVFVVMSAGASELVPDRAITNADTGLLVTIEAAVLIPIALLISRFAFDGLGDVLIAIALTAIPFYVCMYSYAHPDHLGYRSGLIAIGVQIAGIIGLSVLGKTQEEAPLVDPKPAMGDRDAPKDMSDLPNGGDSSHSHKYDGL